MNHPQSYRNKRVVILGLAKSGSSVAELFHQYGALVTINDKKDRTQCPEAKKLENLGLCVICGTQPAHLIDERVALVVKNPGIPYTVAPLVKAMQLGIEIVTEIEVAYHLSKVPIVGITGSNGKTTTTTWVSHMLTAVGWHPIVAGNIGVPLCQAVQKESKEQTFIVELSSFQLKGTQQFHPHVGCLLNVTETHLDYHGTMDDYIHSKLRLFANMTADDIAVLNVDDPICRQLAISLQTCVWQVSAMQVVECGVYVDPPYSIDVEDARRSIVYADGTGKRQPIVAVTELQIMGGFNINNALSASAIAIALGVEPLALAEPLRSFRGVEHRLEFVGEHCRVKYYNNSKATNVEATLRAVQSFTTENIVLIAGGFDRGQSFAPLSPLLGHPIKAIVTMGQTRYQLKQMATCAGFAACTVIDNVNDSIVAVEEAVATASEYASPGDIVLLAPACASWDMFASYEERGRMFKAAVHNL